MWVLSAQMGALMASPALGTWGPYAEPGTLRAGLVVTCSGLWRVGSVVTHDCWDTHSLSLGVAFTLWKHNPRGRRWTNDPRCLPGPSLLLKGLCD